MKFYKSNFNPNPCGYIEFPSGENSGMEMLLVSDGDILKVNFLHDQKVNLRNGETFSTATYEITEDIKPSLFVIYVNDIDAGAWILENSMIVNIYDLSNNKLLSSKTFGQLDDIVAFSTSDYISKPCIVLSNCEISSDFTLQNKHLKVEFISLCDQSASPKCCDSLPEFVSVSGYSSLCIPLRDNYDVPDFPQTTTTQPPFDDQITIVEQPRIYTSDDVDHYYVDCSVRTRYGDNFSYWWERSEDGIHWNRITDLQEGLSDNLVSLKQIKKQDFFYRLYIHSPSYKRSSVVFYDFVDRHVPPTTTTTSTTTLAPLPLTPPSAPLNFEASGAFRSAHLTFDKPAFDGRSEITYYGLEVTKNSDNTGAFNASINKDFTDVYVPVASDYDGVLLDYSLRAYNFFGASPEVLVTGIKTILIAPPTVSNVGVAPAKDPYRFDIDWDTSGTSEAYPLLSHSVKFRPSGTTDDYTEHSYTGTASQTSINDVNTFDNCGEYEFAVTATNSIGESIPATGYARMAFLPDAPEDLDVTMTAAAGSNVDLDITWNPPTDSGRCEITDYVYQYKLISSQEWSLPVTVSTTGVQTQSVPSGDYQARVAAINIVGTGDYAYYDQDLKLLLHCDEFINTTDYGTYLDTYLKDDSPFANHCNVIIYQYYNETLNTYDHLDTTYKKFGQSSYLRHDYESGYGYSVINSHLFPDTNFLKDGSISLTLDFWFKLYDLGSDNFEIISLTNFGEYEYIECVLEAQNSPINNTKVIQFLIYQYSPDDYSSESHNFTITDLDFHHVAISVQDKVSLYLDGVRIFQSTNSIQVFDLSGLELNNYYYSDLYTVACDEIRVVAGNPYSGSCFKLPTQAYSNFIEYPNIFSVTDHNAGSQDLPCVIRLDYDDSNFPSCTDKIRILASGSVDGASTSTIDQTFSVNQDGNATGTGNASGSNITTAHYHSSNYFELVGEGSKQITNVDATIFTLDSNSEIIGSGSITGMSTNTTQDCQS
jgi:hypothetical protein